MIRRLTGKINNPNEEFWYHVAQQHELPLPYIPERPKLAALDRLADSLMLRASADITADLAKEIIFHPDLIHTLRMIISVSEKRMYLDFSYLFSRLPHPTNINETLCGCQPEALTRHQLSFFMNIVKKSTSRNIAERARAQAAARYIAEYLLGKGLADMLAFYARLPESDRALLVANLIIPGELQQAEAKLRGHGIEMLLAQSLRMFGVCFSPEGKDRNPMGAHDPNIDPISMQITDRNPSDTFSTDLVVKNQKNDPVAFVVGLIHTSDPGQFGVDKSNTVVAIKKSIYEFNRFNSRKVELWGLVDGVGYSENKAGTIEKMIPEFNCVIQYNNLYKAILRAHELGLTSIHGISFNPAFYSLHAEAYMRAYYIPQGVEVHPWASAPKTGSRVVRIGQAEVYLAV